MHSGKRNQIRHILGLLKFQEIQMYVKSHNKNRQNINNVVIQY